MNLENTQVLNKVIFSIHKTLRAQVNTEIYDQVNNNVHNWIRSELYGKINIQVRNQLFRRMKEKKRV
jgi:hypothetical protein